MSTAEALSAELNALDHEIEELSEQRIILTLTHPICLELRDLVDRRETLRAKLVHTNVIPFRPRSAAVGNVVRRNSGFNRDREADEATDD